MTNQEMLKSVIASENSTKEMKEQAQKMLDQIANKNAKAKENKAKKALELDMPIMAKISEYLDTHKSALGNELAVYCQVSTSKVIALAKKMVASGELEQKEVSISKVGKRQTWSKVVKG